MWAVLEMLLRSYVIIIDAGVGEILIVVLGQGRVANG